MFLLFSSQLLSDLHSTMFLLIHKGNTSGACQNCHLHSTMFLLILAGLGIGYYVVEKFTFHNVSINTVSVTEGNERHEDLHSTMFLLIPALLGRFRSRIIYLHSTMFLLIRVPCACLIATFYLIYIPQCFY